MGKNANFVSHKKSKLKDLNGGPQLPEASALVEGEIAINFAENVETLSIKNESGDVVTFSSDNYYTEKKLGDYFTGEEGSAKTVTDVMIEKERVTAEALIDLRDGKAGIEDVLWERGDDFSSIRIKGRNGIASNGGVSEGYASSGSGYYSHAEGYGAAANGYVSHAEGYYTTANGYASHAEGQNTSAMTNSSHAEGYFTQTKNTSEHASGQYNVSNTANTWSFGHSGNTLFSVGNGRSESMRQNALEIMQNGDIYVLSGETASDGSRARVLLQDGIGTVPTEQVLDETTSTSPNPVSAKAVYDAIIENEEIVSTVLTYLNNNKVGNVEYDSTENKINFYSSGSTSGTIIASVDVSEFASEGLWESGTGLNSVVQKGTSGVASGDYSVAEGYQTSATSRSSHAEGEKTIASGTYSHAEGYQTTASGNSSHAEGYNTKANGDYSHAEGKNTTASGSSSHAEGEYTNANGNDSHAEGTSTVASGDYSHAEGYSTRAIGSSSHAEGYDTKAISEYSHAEGQNTIANGYASHSEGWYTVANNQSEHTSGQYNVSSSGSSTFGDSGNTLFSVGNGTANNARHNAFEIRQNGDIYITSGNSDIKLQDYIGNPITVDQVLDDTTSASTNPVSSKAVYKAVTDNELVWTNAFVALSGTVSAHTANTDIHVTAADKERWNSSSLWESGTGENAIVQKNGGNTASGKLAVAMGSGTTASGNYSVAEGNSTSAMTYYSHAEGQSTSANGSCSHAEGYETLASGNRSHAEGQGTKARDMCSHAEGLNTTASGLSSHAEGSRTIASSNFSHAEGSNTTANGDSSHAEGESTKANGLYSHAEGDHTTASGQSSHAEGYYTVANNKSEHASGQYNESHSASTTFGDSGNTLFSVGNGNAPASRHNAFEIRQNGDIYITSGGTTSSPNIKLQDYIGVDLSNYYDKTEIDDLVGSGFTSSSITDVIIENEEIVSASLTDLDERKLDASAYTPSVELWVSGTGLNSVVQKGSSGVSIGNYSVVEGYQTSAMTSYSHAEGYMTAAGDYSHTEGYQTLASSYSHAEGHNTMARYYSHAEGESTKAMSNNSHAEGGWTTANGQQSHAEGNWTTATGVNSHAEGNNTTAYGNTSHAEGSGTTSNGAYSHTEGYGTLTLNVSEHASGQYNVSSGNSATFGDSGNTLFSVGNGTADDARHNAFEIRQNGDIYITSGNSDINLQDTIESKADKSDLGGLKLVKVTQAEYDALATKDPNTLYVIVN